MRNRLGRLETNILDQLVENGYEAMVVGGAVRDFLLGKEPLDFDIATNAPYEELIEIMKCLGQLKFAGKSFGVLLVGGIEVATYRTDNYICENGAILEVLPTSNAYEDSKRRDFTINSIYYDYASNIFHDFHGGGDDLKHGVIRTVGNPYERFKEDYSRILRALYLSASLDFTIEEETEKAIRELGHYLKQIPCALQGKIIKKVIKAGCFHKFLELLEQYGLLEHMFPEMSHTVGLEQNPMYHKYDVWNHTLEVVRSAENKYKGNIAFVMGAFLHDVGKGLEGIRDINRLGRPSDIGHEEAGVPIAKKICERLELGKSITNEVAMYVFWHGSKMAVTRKSVKHFLFKFKDNFAHIEELKHKFNLLLNFMDCDADGFNDDFGDGVKYRVSLIRELSEEIFENQVFYSNQFKFSASVITHHPNVEYNVIRDWIEFFIRQNIIEEEAVLKILDKQVIK